MTPFNLEQALAGKPFTNDKGWTVEDWHYFKGASLPVVVRWKNIGINRVVEYKESELFMLPEKKKVWIVVYKSINGEDVFCSNPFTTTKWRDDKIESVGDRYLETIEKEYEL